MRISSGGKCKRLAAMELERLENLTPVQVNASCFL